MVCITELYIHKTQKVALKDTRNPSTGDFWLFCKRCITLSRIFHSMSITN